MNSNPYIAQQANIFNGYWGQFSGQVRAGKGLSDFPAAQNLVSKYVTTVARIPDSIAHKMEVVGNAIIDVYPEHYLYPSTDLHFTFMNLDAFFPQGFQKQHEFIFKALDDALSRLPPLEFEVKGMSVFPTTIFAQLFDTNGVIEQYRRAIQSVLQETIGFAPIENKSTTEHVVFVNLIRFKDVPSPGIVDLVESFQKTKFGSFRPFELELVTTDKLFSSKNTLIHHTFPLAKD
jgi:hypothetical protein